MTRQETNAMPTLTMLDTVLDVDAEGFLQTPTQWNEAIAEAIAHDNGIPTLTDRHWLVIRYMRNRFLDSGTAPSIRTLGKESGVDIKELYKLFPKGPAKLAAKIGGIPKPKGCI
jgi:TusE/DsrC/DsvC family sulfur relay protein